MERKDFSILVALPEEFNAVIKVLEDRGVLGPAQSGKPERFGEIQRKDRADPFTFVVRQCRDMANVWSAAATASLLTDYSPATIVFIGIGGALQPKHVRLGDVVIVDDVKSRSFQKLCDYESVGDDEAYRRFDEHYGLRIVSPKLPIIHESTQHLIAANWRNLDSRFQSPDIDEAILNAVAGSPNAAKRNCKVLKEQVFSWDLVLNSGRYRTEMLHNEGKLMALDMETFGFYATVQSCISNENMWTDAVVFRGISDYAAYKSGIDNGATNWREIAAINAANAALDFLTSYRRNIGQSV